MRLPEESFAKLIAAAVTLMLAPILWLALDSNPPAVGEEKGEENQTMQSSIGGSASVAEFTGEVTPDEDVLLLITRIETGASELLRGLFDPSEFVRWSPGVFPRVLGAMDRRWSRSPDKAVREPLLLWKARVLEAAIERNIALSDRDRRLRELRQQMLITGGVELFAKGTLDLFHQSNLWNWLAAQRSSGPGEIFETIAILEDQQLAQQWLPQLAAHRELPIEIAASWVRLIAVLAGRTEAPEISSFLRQSISDLKLRRGASPGLVHRLERWLEGVETLARVEKRLDEGSDSPPETESLIAELDAVISGFEDAKKPAASRNRNDQALNTRLAVSVSLDLARALIAASQLQSELLARPLSEGSAQLRARRLLTIGTNAIELGDREELTETIELLKRSGNEFLQSLLEASLLHLDRAPQGSELILKALEEDLERDSTERHLSDWEGDRWKKFADQGRFANMIDRPMLLFENGKSWAELGDEGIEWLKRSRARLERTIEARSDLGYLEFLGALIAFEEGRFEGLEERLMTILDQSDMPAALSRREIGFLLVVCEERRSFLNQRRRDRQMAQDVLSSAADDPLSEQVAQYLRAEMERDESGLQVFSIERIRGQVDELVSEMTSINGGLPYDLVAEWELLSRDLFVAAGQFLRKGERLRKREPTRAIQSLSLALELFDRVAQLGGQDTLWEQQSGELQRELARYHSDLNSKQARNHWVASAEHFLQVARSGDSYRAYYLDAARAFIAAGELKSARESLIDSERLSHGARDDSEAWEAILLAVEIEYRAGNSEKVLWRTQTAIEDQRPKSPDTERLLIHQAWALEDLGREEEALQALDTILRDLGPQNPEWQRAVFQRAQILERNVDRTNSGTANRAREAWAEAATWLNSGTASANKAVACYYAAERTFRLGDSDRALGYLETMFQSEDAFLQSNPSLSERGRWKETKEKALYTKGDIYQEKGDDWKAEEAYLSAIEINSHSPQVPLAYLMLGGISESRGDAEESLALYRRGLRKARDNKVTDPASAPYLDVRSELEAAVARLEVKRGR